MTSSDFEWVIFGVHSDSDRRYIVSEFIVQNRIGETHFGTIFRWIRTSSLAGIQFQPVNQSQNVSRGRHSSASHVDIKSDCSYKLQDNKKIPRLQLWISMIVSAEKCGHQSTRWHYIINSLSLNNCQIEIKWWFRQIEKKKLNFVDTKFPSIQSRIDSNKKRKNF